MTLLFKSRTGQSVTLRPVALNATTLSKVNFGLGERLAADPRFPGIAKVVIKAITSKATLRGAKRVRKMQRALMDPRLGADLRNRIVDLARDIGVPDSSAHPPGARGGALPPRLVRERDAITGLIFENGDLPSKLQQRLVDLVHAEAPLTIINPRAAQEGGPSLNPSFEPWKSPKADVWP
jgi:hypothetical protein